MIAHTALRGYSSRQVRGASVRRPVSVRPPPRRRRCGPPSLVGGPAHMMFDEGFAFPPSSPGVCGVTMKGPLGRHRRPTSIPDYIDMPSVPPSSIVSMCRSRWASVGGLPVNSRTARWLGAPIVTGAFQEARLRPRTEDAVQYRWCSESARGLNPGPRIGAWSRAA